MPIPTTQVLVRSFRRPPADEGDDHKQHLKRKRLTEEATHASSVAARELRAVVGLASTRGLNAEEIFQHFVVENASDAHAGEENVDGGRAGKADVIKGMERLGISLSEEAAALLIETIVRSSGEPTELRSTRTAADKGQLRGNLNQPPRAPEERGYAAVAGGTEITKPGRARETSLQRPTAGRKTLRPLLRQHITAEDLLNFASGRSAQEGKTQSSIKGESATFERGKEEPPSADNDSLPALPQGTARNVVTDHSNQSIRGDAGLSSMRKRARKRGGTGNGGSAKEAARKDILAEEARHGMGSNGSRRPSTASTSGSISANRLHQTSRGDDKLGHPQASLSTMSSLSAAGNAIGAPTTAGAMPPTATIKVEAPQKQDAPRTISMPNQVGPLGSGRNKDVQERNGRLLGSRRRWTFSACSESVTAAPAAAAVASASHEKLELASFPCDNPTQEATGGKDRVFYVDR